MAETGTPGLSRVAPLRTELVWRGGAGSMRGDMTGSRLFLASIMAIAFIGLACGLQGPDPEILGEGVRSGSRGGDYAVWVDVTVRNNGEAGDILISAEVSQKGVGQWKKEQRVMLGEDQTESVTLYFPEAVFSPGGLLGLANAIATGNEGITYRVWARASDKSAPKPSPRPVTPRPTPIRHTQPPVPTPTLTPSTPASTPILSPTPASTLYAATTVVNSRGYTIHDTSTFQAGMTLNILIGVKTGSADGYDKLAFFFVNGQYIGTDTLQPSASIRMVWRTGDTIALSYNLYQGGDPMCCPTGGAATVRYYWDGKTLTPLDPIPPVFSPGVPWHR